MAFLRRACAPINVSRQFIPFSTTIPDDNFLGIVESSPSAAQLPDEFPFRIQKNEQQQYQLRRKYQDEIIEVAVGRFDVNKDTKQIPLTAQIYGGSQHLLFEIIARATRIAVPSVIMKDTVTGHVKAFQNHLEIRGFNSSTINSLIRFQQSFEVPVGFPFKIRRLENGKK